MLLMLRLAPLSAGLGLTWRRTAAAAAVAAAFPTLLDALGDTGGRSRDAVGLFQSCECNVEALMAFVFLAVLFLEER